MKKALIVLSILIGSIFVFASEHEKASEVQNSHAEEMHVSEKAKTEKKSKNIEKHGEEEGMSAETSLRKLKDGNKRFITGKSIHPNQNAKRRNEISKGQKPFAIVVTCSDSRVPPELLFDQGQGDLFVIRTAGNVVTDIELGSIEYAAEHLHVPLVVVLGHERCGAVDATVKGGEVPGSIGTITQLIRPAVEKARETSGDVLDKAVRINVDNIVLNIKESEPILKKMVEEKEIKVMGGYYDLDSGEVEFKAEHISNAKESLKELMAGNKRYTSGKSIYPEQDFDRRKEVAKGQNPSAVIISCSDSRIPPEIVFDQGFGNLFIIRTAGNVIDDVVIGSIEYAVEHLHAPLVMVLGHEKCGAVDATVKGGEIPGHIKKIADEIMPAVDAVRNKGGDIVDKSVRNNVIMITEKLRNEESIISEEYKEGKIDIVSGYYDLDTGVISILK